MPTPLALLASNSRSPRAAEGAGLVCWECCHGRILGTIGAEVKVMMNIRFNYLYRDAGNFKQYGSVVFRNPLNRSLAEIEAKLQQCLIDGMYFVAEDLNLPALQQYGYDAALDHDWHEFESVEYCEEPIDDSVECDIAALVLDLAGSHKSYVG
jgi:hypothetical protein